jgi:hypothetical protein
MKAIALAFLPLLFCITRVQAQIPIGLERSIIIRFVNGSSLPMMMKWKVICVCAGLLVMIGPLGF